MLGHASPLLVRAALAIGGVRVDSRAMPGPEPSPLSVSENSEQGRAFLQAGVALFWK